MTAPWIAFEDQMPTPPHGRILVTNNVEAKDAQGFASHVSLVYAVHHYQFGVSLRGHVLAEEGEVTAVSETGVRLRGLTHWRPALPEEWGQGSSSEPLPCPCGGGGYVPQVRTIRIPGTFRAIATVVFWFSMRNAEAWPAR